jgi:hypothetical protein
MPAPRDAQTRKADTLLKLSARQLDVWLASASIDGTQPVAHMIPVRLAWIDERVVVAVSADQQTGRNLLEHGKARLALGSTTDVVIIDAVLERMVAVGDAPDEFAQRYSAQADWDPRQAGGAYAYMVLRPERIQAWREQNEIQGRTLMRGGAWTI